MGALGAFALENRRERIEPLLRFQGVGSLAAENSGSADMTFPSRREGMGGGGLAWEIA